MTQELKFRKKRVYFSQVSNTALDDDNLGLKAKGLYSMIQRHITIEGFILYKTTLMKKMKDGKKAFESAWKELKDAGYLIQYRLQGEKGCFYYEYELLDEPNVELATQVHASQNRKKQEEKNHNPKKGDMDESEKNHNPKMDDMDNGGYAKGGVYNNTYPSNIDLNNTTNNISSSSNSNNINNNLDNIEESEEEDIRVRDLLKLCQKENFKLKKTDIESFLVAYDVSKIAKAIISAASTSTEIKNYRGYITKVLADMETIKPTTINVTKQTPESKEKGKDLKFNDFPQRDIDYNDLERKLLGWDNEDDEEFKDETTNY